MLAALRRRGLAVGSFKVGPDYIDPAFHSRRHRPRRPTMSTRGRCASRPWPGLLEESGRGCDLLVGEGVMGLFDGAADGTGSTADIAALFGLPVVLVVDVTGMGASVAALIDGFRRHREDVEVNGVMLNRVASPAHAELLGRACSRASRRRSWARSRATRLWRCPAGIWAWSRQRASGPRATFLDARRRSGRGGHRLDRLQRLARPPSVSLLGPDTRPLPPLGQRIAVARDRAFAFAYAAVLDGWRRQGAELLPFSPLADEAPDPAADAVSCPAAIPSCTPARSPATPRFMAGLRAAADRGAFVYGECGGYMVAGPRAGRPRGPSHPMAGLLPVVDELRRAAAASRLPADRAARAAARSGRPGRTFAATSSTMRARSSADGQPLFRARGARGLDLGAQGCRAGGDRRLVPAPDRSIRRQAELPPPGVRNVARAAAVA